MISIDIPVMMAVPAGVTEVQCDARIADGEISIKITSDSLTRELAELAKIGLLQAVQISFVMSPANPTRPEEDPHDDSKD